MPIARGQERAQRKEHTAENNSRIADDVLREDDEEAPLQEEGKAEDVAAEETERRYPLQAQAVPLRYGLPEVPEQVHT